MLPFICRYNILVRTETIFTIPFTLYIALYIFHCWFSKSSYQNISLNSAAVWKLSLKEREMRLRFQNWLVGSVCLCPAVGFSQAPWASLTRWRTTCQASSYHPTHRLAKEKAFPHPVVWSPACKVTAAWSHCPARPKVTAELCFFYPLPPLYVWNCQHFPEGLKWSLVSTFQRSFLQEPHQRFN